MIGRVLGDAGIASRIYPSLDAVSAVLEESSAVMATEEALSGEALPPVLDWVARQPAWSDLPFIILATKQPMSRSPAAALTLERLGNAVLLERPLNAESLTSAARAALRARRRQLAMRELTETLEARVAQRTRALAESEARFRVTFDGFPESLFVVMVGEDGSFSMEGHNPAAELRTGWRSDEVVGKPVDALFPETHAHALNEHFALCVARGSAVDFTQDLQLRHAAGVFETSLTPMRDAQGRIVRLLGVTRDVTERNRMEERLRTSQKLEAVGQLTGGVAHDFNNLLQVVLSGLTLIERVGDVPRRAQLLESVRRAAQRGGDLTKRLLTIARRQSLRPEPIDLAAWLGDGVGDLLGRTLRGDISTVIRVDAGLPPVEADASELELALLNLAVNARDAMPGGGTLTLSACLVELDGETDPEGLAGPLVRFDVTDTGTGMPPDIQIRVFEPFFTTKEISKGTGLGLAQVYGFARQSGGSVRLRSAPGEGTTVSILLPLSSRAVPDRPAHETENIPLPRAGTRILVCEDDDNVASLVVDMLAQLGHSSMRVNNAAGALEALSDGREIDLLFTDVLMPGGMDGVALAHEARRRRPELPVLLTTGYTGTQDPDPLGLRILHKPYRIDELGHAVQQALLGIVRPATAEAGQ